MTPRAGSGDDLVDVSLDVDPDRRAQDERRPVRTPSDDPFAILVVGDFRGVDAGASGEPLPPFDERVPRAVDRDDLDDVLASLAPSVRIPGSAGAPSQEVEVRALDDFHPDRLLERAPVLRALWRERRTAGGAKSDAPPSDESPPPPQGGREEEGPSGSDVLDDILSSDAPEKDSGAHSGRRGGEGDGVLDDPLEAAADLDAFVRRVTRPHEVPDRDPAAEARLAELDREISAQLRRLLHDPRFQALEARWRALAFLVRRLETGPHLKVFVLQASRAELLDAAGGDGLLRLLERTSRDLLGDTPWAAVVVDHAFGAEPGEVAALGGLAGAGSATGTAFLAEPDPSLFDLDAPEGDGGGATVWAELRGHAGAGYVALLLPRFLLRLPYAEGENPCESLDFRELEEGVDPDPRRLLWGHPGFLAAFALGHAYRRDGWSLRPGDPDRISGLPLGVHPGEEGAVALPSTEIRLERGDVRDLLDAGFSPVVARPGEGVARLPRLRGLAEGGGLLRGPW